MFDFEKYFKEEIFGVKHELCIQKVFMKRDIRKLIEFVNK